MPAHWIRPADDQAVLMSAGKGGTVDFQLTFSPEGRVSSCAVKKSSGVVLLDVITCRISTRRARASEGEARVQNFRHAWKLPTV